MERAITAREVLACDGCGMAKLVLHFVDGSKICDDCREKSARIDRQLAEVHSDDPVACDGCGERVDFDARVAVVIRGCGGRVLCENCKTGVVEGRSS